MKLSVIIPIYNVEAYLEKCVESVLAFPMEKEVILVDDGSQDRSGEICERLAMKDEGLGIKVIHQENKGVSAARNAGLDIATGDYVWFVDSDDTVLSEELKIKSEKLKIDSQQSDNNYQLSIINYQLIILGFIWDENGVANTFGASVDEVPYNLWRCWFSRNTIEENHIRFTEGRKYAEDQEFILRFMICDKQLKLSAIPEPLYYYTLRPGSAMTKKGVKGKKIKDIAAVLFGFAWNALVSGFISRKWVWRELKRMTKCLYVTIIR